MADRTTMDRATHPPGRHPDDTFTRRYVPALGRTVHRLGVAGNYGLDSAGMRAGLDQGPEYVLWTPRMRKVTSGLRDALAADREKYVVATGPTVGYTSGNLRSVVDKTRKQLATDYIDVLHLFWLGKTSAWRASVIDQLVALRETGAVRAIGVSIHDRKRAGQLAEDSPLDVLMIRYNAAHPGAEQDIFPHLHHRRPAVVSYTATAWRKLLKVPKGWDGPPATPGDCYQFALSNEHVDIVLTGAADLSQLEANLRALDRGPLTEDEMSRIRAFGRLARKSGGTMRWFGG